MVYFQLADASTATEKRQHGTAFREFEGRGGGKEEKAVDGENRNGDEDGTVDTLEERMGSEKVIGSAGNAAGQQRSNPNLNQE